MSSNHSPHKHRHLLLEVSLALDTWKLIYEYLDKEDLQTMHPINKEHNEGIKLFVKEFVESYEKKYTLPKRIAINSIVENFPPSFVPLWDLDLDFDANKRNMKALHPTILYKQILLQRKHLSFNQTHCNSTFNYHSIMSENEGGTLIMARNNKMHSCNGNNVFSPGFGVSNRLLVPGQCYRVSATFEYEYGNQYNRFGITRPMTHSDIWYRYGSILSENGTYEPTQQHVMSRYLPLAWQQESSVNAVLFSEYSGWKDVEITTGNGGTMNNTYRRAVQAKTTNIVKKKCLCCKNSNRMVQANFELDLRDKSNGKFLLLTLDCDRDTQTYRHHLLADGLVGEFVWTGIIGVVGNSTTKIHMHDWDDIRKSTKNQ